MSKPKPFHASFPRGAPGSSSSALWVQANTGMNELIKKFQQYCDWLDLDILPDVLVEALEPTMDLSDHYAPKDTHTMVNSRYNEVRKGPQGPRAEVGYNRHGEAPYTIFVHEMPQFYHKPPTQYKFLQRAMDEDLPELVGRVAIGIKKRTGI